MMYDIMINFVERLRKISTYVYITSICCDQVLYFRGSVVDRYWTHYLGNAALCYIEIYFTDNDKLCYHVGNLIVS